jgi:hypothetical protein
LVSSAAQRHAVRAKKTPLCEGALTWIAQRRYLASELASVVAGLGRAGSGSLPPLWLTR